jgi:Abortive infection alpha
LQSSDDRLSDDLTLVSALPGLVRLSAAMWWKATEWGLSAYVRASSRVIRAAARGESVSELLQDAGTELREYVRQLLEIVEAPESGRPGAPAGKPEAPAGTMANGKSDLSQEELRERGAELLRRSADVRHQNAIHPAYANILENLAPDEGRILRLLALEGPQPSIDVRTSAPLGIGSEMVASGMTMIGRAAGCRHPDQVHAYLGNLYRLGMIWFSREQLEDQNEYQVLEAQPEVQVAMSEAGRTRTVRRSIHLTAFGRDFCDTCLPLDSVEIDALPQSTKPS